MNKLLLLLILFPTTAFSQIDNIEPTPLFSIEEHLYNTSDIKYLGNETLLIVDNNLNFPLYSLSITENEVKKQIRRGEGPGEVSGRQKDVTIINGYVYVWDLYNQRLNKFSNSL